MAEAVQESLPVVWCDASYHKMLCTGIIDLKRKAE
jgi:hypothetical protein